jgi:hypothetical protein
MSNDILYPEIGICGLSCRLCPRYHTDAESRCGGCKSESRMAAGCPFITCAIKKKGVEFCWNCAESMTCKKWQNHRAAGEKADSFICYQKLEANIASVQEHGVDGFEVLQKKRENLLKEFLQDFNEGRSKSNFCIAATVLEIKELEGALQEARQKSEGLDRKEKSRLMHTLLDEIAAKKGYLLKLRKGDGKCPQKT